MSQLPFSPPASGEKKANPFSKLAPEPSPSPQIQSEKPKDRKPFAWQPLTFGGVAAFAHASFKRLFFIQFICAAAATASVLWFLDQVWLPRVFQAIRQMPVEGEIRHGRLDWRGPSPQLLAESHFLAFIVDLNNEGTTRSPAQIEVLFRQKDFKINSLFGFLQSAYPPNYRMGFNQPELQAWWGAWQPWIVGGGTVLLLTTFFLMWWTLATLYFLPAWLAGYFGNRDLSLAGSWRLAGAGLLPGGLFLTGIIVFYGMGYLDVVHLVLATIAHFAIGLVYLIGGIVKSATHAAAGTEKENPFSTPGTSK
ncbi:MAG TPA: hypothetical protein VFA77_11505 [Candidatus Eisenbacteria bacterium]|nr:hypothetical protein [Candidatus Eisenbacteria bacterium]